MLKVSISWSSKNAVGGGHRRLSFAHIEHNPPWYIALHEAGAKVESSVDWRSGRAGGIGVAFQRLQASGIS
jgi:hypothetical protein